MEAEDVEPPSQRGEPAVGDPLAAVAREGSLSTSSSSARSSADVRVAVGAEPLPDRGQPPPVRLVGVRLLGQVDVGRPPGPPRRACVDMPHDDRERADVAPQQVAHELAARSTASRTVAGPTFGLPSRSPPIQRAEPERRAGQARLPDGEQVGRRVPQAVLEEPEPLTDLVDDPGPVGAHLVGLPEDRDLLGELARRRVRAPAA